MLRDSRGRGRGRGGSVPAVAGGGSRTWEARGEAPYPEAAPHRIKPQTHSAPRRRSGQSPLGRSCSDAPERPWAPRTGGTSYGLAVRRWIGARTTIPSCLPSPSSTTRCGTRERQGRRAEGGSCPRGCGCGAWKQAVNDRGRPRQESLHAPFSGRFFQLHFCTPLRSLSRAFPALPVIFFFMALLSCLAPVVPEPRVRINPFFQFGSFGDVNPQGQLSSSCLGSLWRDAPGSHCAFLR